MQLNCRLKIITISQISFLVFYMVFLFMSENFIQLEEFDRYNDNINFFTRD